MKRLALILPFLWAWSASPPLRADDVGPGLDLKGGLAVPLSPVGHNSFSQSYAPAAQPDVILSYRLEQSWLLGLEFMWADFVHQSVAHTDLFTWDAGVVGEYDFDPESLGLQDHFYAQLGLGAGGARLKTAALYQSRQWTSFCGHLDFGWERPLTGWTSLLVEAQAWMLVGPGNADPIATGNLGLGLRFGVPSAGTAP